MKILTTNQPRLVLCITILFTLSISRVRQKKGFEEEKAKEHMERRVNTLLNLKGDINANRVRHAIVSYHMERRVNTLLNLKGDINANRVHVGTEEIYFASNSMVMDTT